MITATSKGGIRRRLIFNYSIMLVEAEDSLSFHVKDQKLNIDVTINFMFSTQGEENTTTGSASNDGKTINMILHRWDNSLGVESTKPLEFTTLTKKRVWIKFKTAGDITKSFRSFQLTVWGEE